MKKKIFSVFLIFVISYTGLSKTKESQLYEHYIGYTHLGYSLLLDKMQNSFVYYSLSFCITGEYKESIKNDTIFLYSDFSSFGEDYYKMKCILKKCNNKVIDITRDCIGNNEQIFPPCCPVELEKIKVPELNNEKKIIKYRPWIIR